MPKISADSVAAHRASKEQEIVAVAAGLIADGAGAEMTIGGVAAAVGLTRTAVYKYFDSVDDIRWRIVSDAFDRWQQAVALAVDAVDAVDTGDAVDTARAAHDRIEAYVDATLALADDGAHRIAMTAGGIGPAAERADDLRRLHAGLRVPLEAALTQLGSVSPPLTASLIDGLIGRAIELMDNGENVKTVTGLTKDYVARIVGLEIAKDQR